MRDKAIYNYNHRVYEVIYGGRRRPKGNVFGLEIEVEGRNLPNDLETIKWKRVNDGSLRGAESAEYVFAEPLGYEKLVQALDELQREFDRNGSRIDDSIRTSVHLHVNVSDLTVKQLYQFLCLYYMFEETLTQFAGPARIGNVFCLQAADAEFIVEQLVDAARKDRYFPGMTENNRYAAANLVAVAKFGSLEFRALRGTVDKKLILDWVNLIVRLKDYAIQKANPPQLIEEMSILGPQQLAREVFGKYVDRLNINERLIRDGMRLAQEVAYSIEWLDNDPGFRPGGLDEEDYIIQQDRFEKKLRRVQMENPVIEERPVARPRRNQPRGLDAQRMFVNNPLNDPWVVPEFIDDIEDDI